MQTMVQGAKTGLEEFIRSLRNLPSQYGAIRDLHLKEARRGYRAGTRHFGPRVERVVEDVLRAEGLPVSRNVKPLYKVKIGGKRVGRVKPDLTVGDRSYVEVTKWGDSNKLASILANGLLVKARHPDAKYYAVVASYRSPEGWTDEEEVDFWLGTAMKRLHIRPLDGHFGFATIDALARTLQRC